MLKLELEIKLRVRDRPRLDALLPALGARLLHPRELEDNQLYDFPDRSLETARRMLRLRRLGRGSVLTLKESPRIEQGAKARDEMEVMVQEAEILAAILGRLGLVPLFRYQKYRTTYGYRDLFITIDETPIGSFLELEGPKPLIDEMAGRLGYEASDYILETYRDLYTEHARTTGKSPDSMLFDP